MRTGAQAAGELELLARADPGLSLLIVGHTHRPLAYGERRGRRLVGPRGMLAVPAAERHLLNPGAVGQARECRVLARCLVLDLDRRHVRFRAVPYDQGPASVRWRRRGSHPARIDSCRPRCTGAPVATPGMWRSLRAPPRRERTGSRVPGHERR